MCFAKQNFDWWHVRTCIYINLCAKLEIDIDWLLEPSNKCPVPSNVNNRSETVGNFFRNLFHSRTYHLLPFLEGGLLSPTAGCAPWRASPHSYSLIRSASKHPCWVEDRPAPGPCAVGFQRAAAEFLFQYHLRFSSRVDKIGKLVVFFKWPSSVLFTGQLYAMGVNHVMDEAGFNLNDCGSRVLVRYAVSNTLELIHRKLRAADNKAISIHDQVIVELLPLLGAEWCIVFHPGNYRIISFGVTRGRARPATGKRQWMNAT